MNRFPRYNFPFQYYNYYRRNPFIQNKRPPIRETNIHQDIISSSESLIQNNSIKYHTQKSTPTISTKPKKDDNIWLDLFGIKLYFDDVLILGLIYFLYLEEVKDEGLFLALVLLLIS